jgi:predicted RNA polymerase sigma factor
LCEEAIRLARILLRLYIGEPEIMGLTALLLLQHARAAARLDADDAIVLLEEQDRSLWNQELIAEGLALVSKALRLGKPGPYQVQAAIAAVHDEATRAEDTDWPQILALYGLLERMSDNPLVTLNRAIALAMVHGPRAGLDLLEPLEQDPRLSGSHRLDAVRAHLFEIAGDEAAAIRHYRAAAAKTASVPERNYLMLQSARVERASRPSGD